MRALLRRLPLLVVVLLLAWILVGDRPRQIDLIYDLPDDPPPTRASFRIVDGEGRVPAAIEWGGGEGPAADRQLHRARLRAGTYLLQAELIFADGKARTIERELSISGEDERIVLHLR